MAQPNAQPAPVVPPILGRFGPGMPVGKIECPKDARGCVRRLWGYLRRQRNVLIVTVVLVAITTALNVVGPFFLKRTIDEYLVPGDLRGLSLMCALMLGLHVTSSLLAWMQAYLMAGAAQRAVRDIRSDLFARLQKLPLRFFDENAHGDLMSRLTNDVDNVSQVLNDGLVQIVSGVLGLVGVAGMMIWINPRLAAVSLTTVLLASLLLNRLIAPRLRKGFRQQQESLGELNGLIEETITGQRVVQACRREPVVIEQFSKANQAYRRKATRAQTLGGFMGPMMNCVNNLGLAIVTGFGGFLAIRGLASAGTIAGFIIYTRHFGRPLNELANLYGAIQSAIAGAERVFAVIDQTPEVDAPDAALLSELRGEVVFENVSFAYTPGASVLKDISLHARPGQVVALVGPTGAGKTTMVNLLTRFYEIESGRVCIDGRDLRQIPREELRRQLGIVLQDTFLFAGSVMENIRYGRLDASDDHVIAAATLANADQFIHRLPQGYATLLSERGSNLSQGQRQLLAIARAVLADPRILILDEATSSVDTRTEQHIQEAMKRLMANRTSFVIAHRLSTIREADQILVIQAGQLIERGTHAELLAKKGFYASLYAGQVDVIAEEGYASSHAMPDTRASP